MQSLAGDLDLERLLRFQRVAQASQLGNKISPRIILVDVPVDFMRTLP